VACIGSTGEDYAVPGHNALVLETNDPQEFLDLFGALHLNPTAERALRQAGRVTARHYTWSHIIGRNLLPRLHPKACSAGAVMPVPPTTATRRPPPLPTVGPQARFFEPVKVGPHTLNGRKRRKPAEVR
jgi:hypothetical protein